MFPSESMLQAALASSGSSISSDTNATVNDIKESMDFLVPQQWQVPMVVLVRYILYLYGELSSIQIYCTSGVLSTIALWT